MDFTKLTPEEIAQLVRDSEDKDVLRAAADFVGVTYSGNTGVEKLKTNILAELVLDEVPDSEGDPNDPVLQALAAAGDSVSLAPTNASDEKPVSAYSMDELYEMDPNATNNEFLKRRIVKAKATRLHRVRITNLDPNDQDVPGAIVTVHNKYAGTVKKYIPYGEENEYGYHVPEIILKELKRRKYALRKEIKKKGSAFGVKEYKTSLVPKFAIEVLPPLTPEELKALAQDQKARGAVG
ncbi:hypothetical protein HYO99_gp69 [Roseobacter phage RD-1410W1-01]|uniref:Uncharacterized protein n=1 Tax=Roseobacter phage RD-1410W1-01 TaxID=1815984 RepID=A0A191VYL7_9CAUD|nr:hypothetical protein HYO99_gp69 [Roseobacter phage RD-1410W1-01]ANJ20803.1 hypothetical protein RDp01_gp69 [Roseobacter phage RD-1410W1-01]